MTKRPKKQLYNPPFLLASLLLVILLGVFVLAIFFYHALFGFLIQAIFYSVAVLVFFHFLFVKKQAELDLQKEEYEEKANVLRADIENENQTIQAYRKKIVNYSCLKEITEKLSMSFSLRQTVKTISLEIEKLFGGEEIAFSLYLFHSQTGEIGVPYRGDKDIAADMQANKGDIYDQWIVKNMTPLLIQDVRNDFRFDVDKIRTESSRLIRSLMSVPMLVGTKAIGILRVDSLQENYFRTEDLRLFNTLADVGAIAMENAQLYEHIEDLATRDSLTGLYLRRHLSDVLSSEIDKELHRKKEYSLLMIDLDKFKLYNDTFGHTAGDILLKVISGILTERFTDQAELICRYGGEEFVVLLPGISKKAALVLAENLRKEIETKSIILRRKKTYITASIGVATAPENGQSLEEVIQKADEAMYKAKNKGRNRVCGA